MTAQGKHLAPKKTKVKTTADGHPLRDRVRVSVEEYFKHLNGDEAHDLYHLLLTVVEEPLFEVVMKESSGNLSKASRILGINRGTLKKKLSTYNLLDN